MLNVDRGRWPELSALLDQVLELPPAERQTWLDAQHTLDHALIERVRTLLAQGAAVETGEWLDTLPPIDAVGPETAGEIVGPYRLLREIGHGGMGSVWLAERTDGLMRRPVALKLPHGAWRRAGLAERMAREREILATLNHPHIATLYDGGVTAAGQPYLALEHVEGEPIDRYCERHGLDTRARIELFLQVTDALAHAHAKLIVHRDLKPSNILVRADGNVRLLDFGIAKLIENGGAETALTQLGGRALTPDYAAPEQIRGAPVSTAADIYALGVLLFELLTGRRPYQLGHDSRAALEQAILSADPPRPSTVARDPRTAKRLRGDLDTIVLKALRKTPEERYGTVAELGDDLRRHLEHLPVRAQPERALYRLRKFVARNVTAVAAAAAVLAALAAGAGVATTQMLAARAQRDAALTEQRRAEAFSNFTRSLLETVGTDERPLTFTELLGDATAMLERASDLDAATAAYMRYEVAGLYTLISQTDQELALLEQAAAGARAAGDVSLFAAARCSAAWSRLDGDATRARSDLDEGEQALAGSPAVSAYARTDCARAKSRLLLADGDLGAAIGEMERTLAALEGDDSGVPVRIEALETQLLAYYQLAGRYRDGLAIAERQLARVRAAGRAGSLTELVTMANTAGLLYYVGEVRAAAEMQRAVIETAARVFADQPVPVGLKGRYAFTLARLGEAAIALQLADEDGAAARAAGNAAFDAQAQYAAAVALVRLDRVDDAAERLARAEQFYAAEPKTNAVLLRDIRVFRAELLLWRRELAPARAAIDGVLAELGYPESPDPIALGVDRALRVAARTALGQQDYAAAASYATDWLERARRRARDPQHSADVGEAALALAEAQAGQGQPDTAREMGALAHAALAAGYGEGHALTREAGALLEGLE